MPLSAFLRYGLGYKRPAERTLLPEVSKLRLLSSHANIKMTERHAKLGKAISATRATRRS